MERTEISYIRLISVTAKKVVFGFDNICFLLHIICLEGRHTKQYFFKCLSIFLIQYVGYTVYIFFNSVCIFVVECQKKVL